MEEEKQPVVSTKIEDGKKNVYIDEHFAFSLSENFPDDYVMEVFTLADNMFGEGARFGIARVQNDVLKAMGMSRQVEKQE